MKKFNFNFKFLDRFKKNRADENSETIEDVETSEDSSEDSESDNDQQFQFQTMTRGNINDGHNPVPHVNSPLDDESYSDENPEEFAEKTLSNFNLDKFREENQHLMNNSDYDEKTDHNIQYTDMEPPGKPEKTGRFNFKFPKWSMRGSDSGESSFKDRLAGANPVKSLDKFSWNDFILRLFSPYSRSKIHGAFVILLVVTFTYLIGKSVALFMGRSAPMVSNVKSNIVVPIEKSDTTVQDINRITSVNLFNIKESDKAGTKKEQKDIASIVCLDAEKPTSEPLKLLDTIVLQDSVKSVASVQVRGAAELVNVREGEQINSVEVAKINRMKIILKNLNTGDCEYIASEEQEAPLMLQKINVVSAKKGATLFKSMNPEIKNNGNTFKIKRQFRDKMVTNISEVLTQAKAIQIVNPDGSLCFKMTEVVPGSIYSQLNIQNEDVICNINGKKIENLNELMGLMGRIKEIDQFQIGMKRNGMQENLDYSFE